MRASDGICARGSNGNAWPVCGAVAIRILLASATFEFAHGIPDDRTIAPPSRNAACVPASVYSRHLLVLQDAVAEDDGGNAMLYPIVVLLHCLDGRFTTGWIDGSSYLPRDLVWSYGSQPCLVDASGLRRSGDRLRGRLTVGPNFNRYDFAIDAAVDGGTVNGGYERTYRYPDGPRAVDGTVSGGVFDEGGEVSFSIVLDRVIRGAHSVSVLVEGDRAHGMRAYQPRNVGRIGHGRGVLNTGPGMYNVAEHVLESSDLRLDGNRLQGRLEILIRSDGYVPEHARQALLSVEVDAGLSAKNVVGRYNGMFGVERRWYGAVKGLALPEAEVRKTDRLAPGADWPCWRGPTRNGAGRDCGEPVVADLNEARLAWRSEADILHKDGAKGLAWSRASGTYNAPVVSDGRVYHNAFAHRDGSPLQFADDTVVCMDAATGLTLWRRDFRDAGFNKGASKGGGNAGHCMACVADGKAFVWGTSARVYCLDAASGELLWDNDTGTPRYDVLEGQAQVLRAEPGQTAGGIAVGWDHPAAVADGVFVCAGGSLCGFDANTGRLLWKAHGISKHGGLVRWVCKGKEYLLFDGNCLEPRTGRLVWTSPDATNHGTPAVAEINGQWYMILNGSGSAKRGAQGYLITPEGSTKLWGLVLPGQEAKDATSPVLYRESAYALAGAGILRVNAITGEVEDTIEGRYGNWSSLVAGDNRLFVEMIGLRSSAGFRMACLEPGKFGELTKRLMSHAMCVTPVYADGRFFVWGNDGIYCYDLRLSTAPGPAVRSLLAGLRTSSGGNAPPPGTNAVAAGVAASPDVPPFLRRQSPVRRSVADIAATRVPSQAALADAYRARSAEPARDDEAPSPETLGRYLGSAYLSDRAYAIEAAGRLRGDARDRMRRCALDAAASGRFEAIESALPALEAAGAGPEVAPALVEMLLAAVRAGRPHAAELTMESLGRIAAPARRDAVRRIAELAAETADSRSRVAACRALAVAGIDSLAAVDLLVRLLESGDPEVALAAARAFGAMDAAPAAAIPLARQLRGDVEPLLRACVLALRRTGPDAAPAAPELVALLLRADKRTFSVPHMSREVAATLGVMGERGVAGLIEILTSSQGEDVTAPAARVLAEYGAEAIPALVAALNSNGLAAKRTAVVLGDLGGDIGTAVVPALVRALDRTDIAPWAAMSLIRIGGGAEFWGEEAMDRVAREGSVGAQFDLVSMGDRLLRHGLPRTSRRAYARAMARILETGNPRAPLEGAMRNLGALGADAAEAAALVQKWVGTESDLSGAAAIASALIRGEPPPKR